MAEKLYDVIIVGGGPAGLSCAIYASRAKPSTLVLDRAPTAGSLATASVIENFPGVPSIKGSDLLDIMRDQAITFGTEYLKSAVMAVELQADPKVVYTSDDTYKARSLVIATGAMGRQQRIENEENFMGRGVAYCVTCDAAFYTDKVAAVVGYNEVAMEEALFLARFAKTVHLVTPKHSLVGPTEMLQEVTDTANIVVNAGMKAKKILGDNFVTGLEMEDVNGQIQTLDVEGVFMLLTGRAPITDFLNGCMNVTESGCIVIDHNGATCSPGVWAVGDVTCLHPKQAIIAAGEGVIAALDIDRYLSGRDRAKVDYH